MNRHGANAIFFPQPAHGITLRRRERERLPLPGAGRKNLKCIGTQPISSLGSHLNAASCRGMYPNTPGTRLGWFAFRPQEYVLHTEPLASLMAKRFLLSHI